MSKNSLRPKDQRLLVGRAAMRCEFRGCNELLSEDQLSRSTENFGAFAHIVADSEDGPRGETGRSQGLARDLENFMLLCLKHHKLIDGDHWEEYPEDLLLEMKAEHEERIRRLTEYTGEHRTHLLLFESAVGERSGHVSESDARRAALPRYAQGTTWVALTRSRQKDGEHLFWESAIVEVQRAVDELHDLFNRRCIGHTSVFAMAPVPLLIWLGYRLGDLYPADAHQKRRFVDDHVKEASGWAWREDGDPLEFGLSPDTPDPITGDAVLWMAVSARPPIPDELEALPRVELFIGEPRADAITTRAHLDAFKHFARSAMLRLERAARVHVIAAVPNSVAVEFGRLQLPKAHEPLVLYDRHEGTGGQAAVLELHAGGARCCN